MKKIVFFHIPKTGGTSVHDFLLTQFDKKLVCPDRYNTLVEKPKAKLEKYIYFSGHYDIENVRHINGEKDVFTFVRDPKERILSFYYFWKSFKQEVIDKHNLLGPRLAKSMSLLDFLKSDLPAIRQNYDNYLVRALTGKFDTGPKCTYMFPENELVDRSIESLNTFTSIGIMDNYDASFKRVISDLGFTPPVSIPHRRNSKKTSDPNLEKIEREEITNEISYELDRLVAYDDLVYKHIKKSILARDCKNK